MCRKDPPKANRGEVEKLNKIGDFAVAKAGEKKSPKAREKKTVTRFTRQWGIRPGKRNRLNIQRKRKSF